MFTCCVVYRFSHFSHKHPIHFNTCCHLYTWLSSMIACKVSKLKRLFYSSVFIPSYRSTQSHPDILISMVYLFYSLQISSLPPWAKVWQKTEKDGRRNSKREINWAVRNIWVKESRLLVLVYVFLNSSKQTWAGVNIQNPGTLVKDWGLCLFCCLTVSHIKLSTVSGKIHPSITCVHRKTTYVFL